VGLASHGPCVTISFGLNGLSKGDEYRVYIPVRCIMSPFAFSLSFQFDLTLQAHSEDFSKAEYGRYK